MNELAESVGTVTAIGMGTVFVCLVLLYGMTLLLGSIMSRANAPAKPARSPAAAQDSPETATTETEEPSGPSREAIAAAITLVLARHRASRSRPDDSRIDAWKLAGRVRALRSD